jgi:hypothetical protein
MYCGGKTLSTAHIFGLQDDTIVNDADMALNSGTCGSYNVYHTYFPLLAR